MKATRLVGIVALVLGCVGSSAVVFASGSSERILALQVTKGKKARAPAKPKKKNVRPAPPPKLTNKLELRQSKVVGSLDGKVVHGVMRQQRWKLRICHQAALDKQADLAGKVRALFVIGEKGRVTWAKSTGLDPEVSQCITQVVRKTQFPAPSAGRVRVFYDLFFGPAGAEASKPESKPEPEPEPKPNPETGKGVRMSMKQKWLRGGLDEQAVRSQLESKSMQLRGCYEKHSGSEKANGPVNARFSIGSNGAVVYTKALGAMPEVGRCITDVIRKLRFPETNATGTVKVSYIFTFTSA